MISLVSGLKGCGFALQRN
uniref:Uncharacterized protein n=1 Tax=Rhizophora mucronata TaxID=61149 RepID=A0A2P2Q366_RHIMU